MTYNPFRSQIAARALDKPDAYNPYAAGAKVYGMGRSQPTIGPVDNNGYVERDAAANSKKNAILQRLKAEQSGNYMSTAYMGGQLQ